MNQGSTFRNLLVGLVFLGSLVVLGAVTLSLKELPFLSKAEARSVRFEQVDSLREGDPVVLHGLRVGEIRGIEYDPATNPKAPILVRFSVPQSVSARLPGAKYTIHSAGPLGGRLMEIALLPMDAPPPTAGTEAIGTAPGDVFRQVQGLFQKTGPDQVTLPELLNNLDAGVKEFKKTFELVNKGQGTIGDLVVNEKTREKTTKGLSDLFEVIENLKGEKGVIPYLLNNEQAKEDVRALVSDAKQMLREVREGKGALGSLLMDIELQRTLKELVVDGHEVLHKLNEGEGTLGQLLNNPKAWEELVKALVLVRETVEDLREQAPVSTFVNAAFSAF